jgi:hypothetical protein
MSAEPQMALSFMAIVVLVGGIAVIGALVGVVMMLSSKKKE